MWRWRWSGAWRLLYKLEVCIQKRRRWKRRKLEVKVDAKTKVEVVKENEVAEVRVESEWRRRDVAQVGQGNRVGV